MKILRTLSILAVFTAGVFCLNAQDIITLKSGEEIKAKVEEISSSEIKYKRFDNLTGPNVVLAKEYLFFIKYENGTKEIINHINAETSKATVTGKAASDNECTVIFYRKNKAIPVILKAHAVEITRKGSEKKIVSLWSEQYYKYVTSDLGTVEFIASVKKPCKKPLTLKLEAGKTYYVSVEAKDDMAFKFGAGIELINEQDGLKAIGTMEEVKQ